MVISGVKMDSDIDNEPINCASDSEFERFAGRSQRQVRLTDMALHNQAKRGSKRHRQTPGQGSRSPGDVISPEAKRSTGDPAGPEHGVELSTGALDAIEKMMRKMMAEENAKVLASLEMRFGKMEKRIELLEAECMDKDREVKALNKQLQAQIHLNKRLQDQIESIDVNRRLSTLILTCDDFKERRHDEDIEHRAVDVLNKRYPNVKLASSDVDVAHRLQGDTKVIVKFHKRRVRDLLYDGRFDMARRCSGGGPDFGVRGGRLRPLYVSESLSASNKAIFNRLMDLRKADGGVASVFTRRGIVHFRREKGGANIRVPDLDHLQRLVQRPRVESALRGPGAGSRPGRPTSAVSEAWSGSPPSAAVSGTSSAAGTPAATGGPTVASVAGVGAPDPVTASGVPSHAADAMAAPGQPVTVAGVPVSRGPV